MRQFLRKLTKVFGYTAATTVILLAIAVGLFRLFLPRLPEYQDQIKVWASDAIGMEVEFSGMNARWAFSGPELEFYDAELVRPDDRRRRIAAEVVSVGISLSNLLFEGAFVVDRVVVRNTSIEVHQLEDGGWWVQGMAMDELSAGQARTPRQLNDVEVVGEDIEIQFLQLGDQRPRFIQVPRTLVSVDEHRIALDATVRLSEDLGREVTLSATRLLGVAEANRTWEVSVEAEDITLAGWSRLQLIEGTEVLSGEGDLDLSMVLADGTISNATADVEFSDVSLVDGQVFDLRGRIELDMSFDGWLVAAEDFILSTGDHEWPESSLGIEAGVDADGAVAMLNLRASYMNLDDGSLLLPLLPDEQRSQLSSLALSGEIRDFAATISDIGGDAPQFDISVNLSDAGIAAAGKRPGIRGFTGHVRANRSGGRVEIRSSNLLLDLPQVMDRPVDILSAAGTVLWRSGNDETIVLSDSIRIINPVLDLNSSLRLTIDDNGGGPDIDLASTFRVSDLNAARGYLPRKVMSAKLYDWFQRSLVKGSMEDGSLTLTGPLDRFPFENGEGRFRIDATARNTTLKYHPNWPAAEQANIEIVLDNARLYSVRNRSTHAGNQTVNAAIDIPDLRNPILKIEGLVTGTLDSLREFALQSPINSFTGGNLNRVTLSGDASFNLDLVVPLKDAPNTTLKGLLRSNNGTLVVDGLKPPITDFIGEIEITRDSIVGDSLGGRFLGREVDIRVGPSEDPRFFAVATATGSATATALIEELGVPLEGLINGATGYTAEVLFPRGGQEEPQPLTINIESDLIGIAVGLPDPAQKPAADTWQLRGDIRFLPGGEGIESAGLLGDEIEWQVGFAATEEGWDIDRGVVMLGGGEILEPETRGLHIQGRTSVVRLEEWLDLPKSDNSKGGAADRVRSIDLTIDNFFAIGQHLRGHHVRLDRSALDWLVQVDGEHVIGSVFVPYDFGSDRPLVVEMERMYLPGDDVTPPSESTLDPTTLPPISLTAADFALGDRHFGAVEINLLRTEYGLESETLMSKDETFEFIGTARWVTDNNEVLGSRTYLTASLNSTDVGPTMSRLDLAKGISGESLGILLDVSWSGGPRASFLDMLDGEVRVRMEQGQLEEVEPGAGRMLGLVSVIALPRRLSLDFSDVFDKGFGYDSIDGTFRITDGNATTCNLSFEGPAADIGIVGGTNLVTNEYEQGAVISANVGATLPIVGAVVGGPPGAAAMLIFSQIFKKPLQEMGQVFYGISGPWEDPEIEPISSDDFVKYGELAGCLPEGGGG
jgi:uncharacterized protein (TIGR02099 family)